MDEQAFLACVRRAAARTVPNFGELLNDHVQAMRQHNASAIAGTGGANDTTSAEDHGSPRAGRDGEPAAAAPAFLGELLGLPAPDDQAGLIEYWAREFEALGGHPRVARDAAGAVHAIARVVRSSLGVRGGYCILTAHPLLAELGLLKAMRSMDLPAQVYRDAADGQRLAAATVSVHVASAAIAETGTLVIESHAHQGRCSSLLPPVHIAVIPPGTLIPGIAGWLARRGMRYQAGEEMPSSTVLATGPSRSADIAGDLTLGVHGPDEVHAILMRG